MSQPAGRARGEVCPCCHEGHLIVSAKTLSDEPKDFMQVELERTYRRWTHIEALICNACSHLFKAKEEDHDVQRLLDSQLEGFNNPEQEPTTCPLCKNDALVQGSSYISIDAFKPSREPEDESQREQYRYCPDCLTVTFHLPKVKSKFELKMESDPVFRAHVEGIRNRIQAEDAKTPHRP